MKNRQNSSGSDFSEKTQDIIKTIVPDQEALHKIQLIFEQELEEALRAGPTTRLTSPLKNIRVIDTGISDLSVTRKTGEFFVLSVEKEGVRAAQVNIRKTSSRILREVFAPYHQGTCTLTDESMTASIFVEAVLNASSHLLEQAVTNFKQSTTKIKLLLTTCYYLEKIGKRNEFLFFDQLTKNNCSTHDPLLHTDLVYLCNVKFELTKMPAEVVQAFSHSSASLVSAALKCPKSLPSCLVCLDLDERIHLSYVQANTQELGYTGSVLDVDIACFNGNQFDSTTLCTTFGLPFTIPDFELDDKALNRDFEKMVCAHSVPEICRLVILRVFQVAAPKSVWVKHSLKLSDCLEILNDTQESEKTKSVIKTTWNWTVTDSEMALLKKLIVSVFSRSAALVAMAIAVIAKRTGRLQPALGGVTVALSGCLGSDLRYQNLLRFFLDKLFTRNTTQLLAFYQCPHAALAGAATLGINYFS